MLALRSSKQLYKTLLLLDNQPLLLFSLQVMTNSMTQWTAACQASVSLIISQSLPKFMSIQLVIPLNHHILYHTLPPAFSASESFPLSQRFTSGGQSIGASASASVLPKSIQSWFPLRLTGLISLPVRDSQESSPTPQLKSVNSLMFCRLYCPALTSVHDCWKNHSLDNTDLCQQSDVFAF